MTSTCVVCAVERGVRQIAMAGVSHTDREAGGNGRKGGYRLLVVATEAVAGPELRDQVAQRLRERSATVHIVSPAVTETGLKHAMGDIDEAVEEASGRLDESLRQLGDLDAEVTGRVGDSDPLLAIEDALQTFSPDEILIVTHPDEDSRWLEADVFDRARHKFEPPITHVVAERDRTGEEHVADVERAPRGVEEHDEPQLRGGSANLPPMSMMDVGGILVAIVGTIVLVVLAATCPGDLEEGGGSDTACVVRAIIAGLFGLINIAHVVGLVLFESLDYRGLWQRFFAQLSLFGTPVAIVASLLIG
jgi:hypothetical protein